MYCEKCGHVMDEATQRCPACDASAGCNQAKHKKTPRAVKVAIAVVLLAVLGAGGAFAYFAWFAKTPIDESHFPDAILRAYVAEFVDADKDGALSPDEAKAVECIGKPSGIDRDQDGAFLVGDVSTFAGIELFPNLKMIVCAPSTVVGDAKGFESEFLCVKEEQVERLDADPDSTSAVFSEYDLSGRLIKQAYANDWSSGDSSSGYYLFEYDEKGNKVKTENYDDSWTKVYTTLCEYDGKGHLTKESGFDADGELHLWTDLSYDEQGNLVSEEDYSGGDLVSRSLHEYDQAGRLAIKTEENYYQGELQGSNKFEYEYDEGGNLIKESYFDAGSLAWYRWLENWADGTVSKSWLCDPDGNELSYAEYDEQGQPLISRSKDGKDYSHHEYNSAGHKTHYIGTVFIFDHAQHTEQWWEYLQAFRPTTGD